MDAATTGPPDVFEAHGYYRVADDGLRGVGTWVDSRGLVLPLVVTIAQDRMTVEWGDDATERGQTVYRLVAGDTLEVIDAVRDKGGQLREFGRSTLRRAR
jgi:hypothetical protein